MIKKPLPKFFFASLVLLFLIAAGVAAVAFGLSILEKRSLKPPPPFKRLTEAQSKTSTASGKIKYPHDYTLVILGDSMTESLGNSDEVRGYLNEYYPDKTFEVLNYGYGSTSILSAKERLTSTTHHGGRDYAPIEGIDYDYLLVESFGNNPLSEYKEDEGLQKQNEILDDLIAYVATTSGKEKLIFVATVGANKDTYAKTQADLSSEVRAQWARERNTYIKNHIDYAKKHGIPVIDVYTASLDFFGNVKQYLIRDDDFIHPSPTGTLFISKKIADFLAKNNLVK